MHGGALLFAGQILSYSCSFLRNIILARLLDPTDFGIAMTFALSLSIFEMVSNLSLDKYLIQNPDGDSPHRQATMQSIQLTRSLTLAIVVFILGGPIASLFGAPQASGAFRTLALVPLCKGFLHLDISRMQRRLAFGPSIIAEISSNIVVTALLYPLVKMTGDYRGMLYAIILQSFLLSLMSHLLAERRYALGADLPIAREVFRFGWPLMVNGLFLFAVLQGDRFLIGTSRQLLPGAGFSLADLGVYSLATSLTFMPAVIVGNIFSALFLPTLSGIQQDSQALGRRYRTINQFAEFMAGANILVFFCLGYQLIRLFFGQTYVAAFFIAALLAISQSMRIMRIPPTLLSISIGDTKISMISNAFRSASLPLVAIAIAFGAPLQTVAMMGILGEVFAYLSNLFLLRKTGLLDVSASLAHALIPFVVVPLGLIWVFHAAAVVTPATTLVVFLLSSVAYLAFSFFVFPHLRNEALRLVNHYRRPRAATEGLL